MRYCVFVSLVFFFTFRITVPKPEQNMQKVNFRFETGTKYAKSQFLFRNRNKVCKKSVFVPKPEQKL